MTAEFLFVCSDRIGMRRERRRLACHPPDRHVCLPCALQMRMTTIGEGFGRDRSTVAHAAVVEDRRDDRDFDEFVAASSASPFSPSAMSGEVAHDRGRDTRRR